MTGKTKKLITRAFVLTCSALLLNVSFAADNHEHIDFPPPSPLLDRIRALAGTWEGTSNDGADDKPTTVNYHLTSGGSAVIETLSPGTDHEMITMYYVDADKLVLTHFCVLGNQPMMTATDDAGPDSLHFICHGGGNIPNENVPHMHEVTHKFIDPDHLQSTWIMNTDGKPAHTAVFTFHRAKK